LHQVFTEKGIAHSINTCGSFISIFFGEHSIYNFKDVSKTDIPFFNRFFHHMLQKGVYLPPSAYETWFLSIALSDSDIEKTLHAASKM